MLFQHAVAMSFSHVWRESRPSDKAPRTIPYDTLTDEEKDAVDWCCNQLPLEPVTAESPSGETPPRTAASPKAAKEPKSQTAPSPGTPDA